MSTSNTVFVIRDFEVDQHVGLALQYLAKYPPTGETISVPGIPGAAEQGRIVADVIVPAITASEYVIAFMDTPNANVGFELGFALGAKRPVALVCAAAEAPSWLSGAPLAGYLVSLRVQLPKLCRIIGKREYVEVKRSPKPGNDVLFLAPRSDEGLVAHQLVERDYQAWRRPEPQGWTLEDLPVQFDGVGEVIWVVTPYAPGSNRRDGQENTLNAVIAGYAKGAGIPLRILKSRNHRELADVKSSALLFQHLHELEERLAQGEEKRKLRLAQVVAEAETEPAAKSAALERVLGGQAWITHGTLEKAVDAARAVGRLAMDGRAAATCFLVSSKHVLVPWHVGRYLAETSAWVVDFEMGRQQRNVTRALHHGGDMDHDYSILELDEAMPADATILPLRPPPPLGTGARVFVIGYPGGGALTMSTVGNDVVGYDQRNVHYNAHTAAGSSGSPVFDEQWNLVAMHRGAKMVGMSLVSEGIRIDFIVASITGVKDVEPILQWAAANTAQAPSKLPLRR